MGGKNKVKKTKWRVLDIADDHNSDDSEESNLTSSSAVSSSGRVPSNGYHPHHQNHQQHQYNSRPYYGGGNKYSSYSSQSTPQRRRQPYYEGSTKSTRSSSTTSETKVTIIDDEYTRITTPRQDVLFKKGYLNKPRQYHSQTSTGASTISTETSTENGTPDHQSTDMDYESHPFVFPNGFVDQNGIYYVNSYEPYPLMLFNPPTYFHEFAEQKYSENKSKRYSTGSLTESMSPNTEEATSQDLSPSGGDTSNNVSDYGGQPLFNLVYPGYYLNGTTCPHNDVMNGHPPEHVRKLRKRRERKSSKTVPGDSTENTTDENSSDEKSHAKLRTSHQNTPPSSTPNGQSPIENLEANNTSQSPLSEVETANSTSENNVSSVNTTDRNDTPDSVQTTEAFVDTANIETKLKPSETLEKEPKTDLGITQDGCADLKTDNTQQNNVEIDNEPNQAQPTETPFSKQDIDLSKSNLKPEAEEFIPRVYQTVPPAATQILPHPNFVPIPLVLNDFNGPHCGHPHQAFIPPGIPIPIITHPGQKIFPPVYGPPPPHLIHQQHETKIEEVQTSNLEKITEDRNNITRTPESTPNSSLINKGTIDIATVVSKLEEAVKEREENLKIEEKLHNGYRGSPRLNKQPYRKSFNKYKGSPSRNSEYPPIGALNHVQNGQQEVPRENIVLPKRETENGAFNLADVPIPSQVNQNVERQPESVAPSQKITTVNRVSNPIKEQVSNSSEYFRKRNQHHTYQSNPGSPRRQPSYKRSFSDNHERDFTEQRSQENRIPNKNYSEMVKKPTPVIQILTKKYINEGNNKKKSEVSSQIGNQPNGWISVSSRKKKKNKNVDEVDFDNSSELEELNQPNEDFESYDINQLVDVVPPSQDEKKIEEILTDLAETVKHSSVNKIPVKIIDVKEIENEILVKQQENITADKVDEGLPEIKPKETEPITEIVEEAEEVTKTKKKSKKPTQKPVTKKVIIKDIDLSGGFEEPKPKTGKGKEKTATINCDIVKAGQKTDISSEESNATNLVPEKKSKKKKKNNKGPKLALNDNLSDSNTTLSTVEDSCDLLLENSLLNTSMDKTNVEMTLELDKLIQKSMFSSLKEKIKSTDPDLSNDAFFQKLGSSASSKNGFNKTPDFNKIFQSTRQFLKPNSGEMTNSWNLPATDDSYAQLGQDPTTPIDLAAQSNRPTQSNHKTEVKQHFAPPESTVNQLAKSPDLQEVIEPDQSINSDRTPSKAQNDDISTQVNQKIDIQNLVLEDQFLQSKDLQDTENPITIDKSTSQTQNDDLSTQVIQKIDNQELTIRLENQLNKCANSQDLPNINKFISINNSTTEAQNDDLSTRSNGINDVQDLKQLRPFKYQSDQDFKATNTETASHQDLIKCQRTNSENVELKSKENEKQPVEIHISEKQGIHFNSSEVKIIEDQTKFMLAIEERQSTNNRELEIVDNTKDTKSLYPITAAVKSWMTKTREVTPEVELLKSPSTIYKELRVSQEREGEFFEEDEEIVIFNSERKETSRKSSCQESDLLEYWENEIELKGECTENTKENAIEIKEECTENKKDRPCACTKCQRDVIEDGIKVYESKYGNNENYMDLQKDIGTRNVEARQGALPRAVCCNVQ